MARFFIDRPIFAWVLAIGVMLVGALALRSLPISRYPQISPPSVSINATYAGASAQAVEDSVTQIIEQKLTGLDGLRYMTSKSSSQGTSSVQLTFEIGTDPDLAQVQVQNKLQQATALLPQAVQNQGVTVTKSGDEMLLLLALTSDDKALTATDLADYIGSTLQTPLSRVPGVGSATLFGAQYAMRIWLDPAKLTQYKLTPADISSAITAQNTQVSVGQLGALPAASGQQLNATITAQSRLQTAEQFRSILLVSTTAGATVRLRDVATVEVGSENYNFLARYNGKPAAGMMIYLATGANATDAAAAVKAEVAKLSAAFPTGMKAEIAYDTTPFIEASIEEVVKTLIEAVVLVFLVMYLFLQNWRATLIPTLAVPVVLLGTFALLSAFGYSINTLTMFALVLAIGLLVDDAIVVVENVERVMAEDKLPALEATRQSMQQITGALVGVAMVLSAVFLPMAFFGGSTGVIYRQFSVTIVSAMVLSVLTAIVFTPALCATLLKPSAHGSRLFVPFNRFVDRTTNGYASWVGAMLKRGGRFAVVYLALGAVMAFVFTRLPSSFVPEEDQGVLMVMATLPAGATQQRTIAVLEQVERHFMTNETAVVASTFAVAGFGLGSSGQNSGMAFIRLKPWAERTGIDQNVAAIQGRAMRALSGIRDATVFALAPPSIPGLGSSSGFSLQLLDQNGQGQDKLLAAARLLVQRAGGDAQLQGVRINGPEETAQYVLDIDHAKAGALGVSISDLNAVLSTAWGGSYVNDFIDRGRVKKVYAQSAADARMLPQDLNKWSARNGSGEMVSFASFSSGRWTTGSPQLSRFDGTASMELQGSAVAGTSSGAAMDRMEALVKEAAGNFGVAWSGLSYEEKLAGSNAAPLYVLSLLVVFLCLAALYESWSVPLAVLLVVPLGILGTVLATSLRGLSNDVYFQVGLLTIVGLTAKNAILIVEFAKDGVDRGQDLIEATLHACRLRLRPIVMTSLAFGLGVLPLALGTGAGSGSQHAVGTGVVGGMVTATLLGVFFVPLLYVAVHRLFNRRRTAPAPAVQGGEA
jgi:multidrug efflux pump